MIRKRLRSGTKKPDKSRELSEIEGENGVKKSHSPRKDTTQRMMRQGIQREGRMQVGRSHFGLGQQGRVEKQN